jgi:hypothetical protein
MSCAVSNSAVCRLMESGLGLSGTYTSVHAQPRLQKTLLTRIHVSYPSFSFSKQHLLPRCALGCSKFQCSRCHEARLGSQQIPCVNYQVLSEMVEYTVHVSSRSSAIQSRSNGHEMGLGLFRNLFLESGCRRLGWISKSINATQDFSKEKFVRTHACLFSFLFPKRHLLQRCALCCFEMVRKKAHEEAHLGVWTMCSSSSLAEKLIAELYMYLLSSLVLQSSSYYSNVRWVVSNPPTVDKMEKAGLKNHMLPELLWSGSDQTGMGCALQRFET